MARKQQELKPNFNSQSHDLTIGQECSSATSPHFQKQSLVESITFVIPHSTTLHTGQSRKLAEALEYLKYSSYSERRSIRNTENTEVRVAIYLNQN